MSSLIEGKWNHAVTSSMDRTIKVWDMSTILEDVFPLPRHDNPVLDVIGCEALGVALIMTRSTLGVWDLSTGALHSTFARDNVGAKVSNELHMLQIFHSPDQTQRLRIVLCFETGKRELTITLKQRDLLQSRANCSTVVVK